jgi:aminoglycoside 6'-N-acetyltransferase
MSPPPAPRLVDGSLVLRGLVAGDRPVLRTILAQESVARWWGTTPLEESLDGLFDPGVIAWAIEIDGIVVGWIQAAEEEEPDYRHASIDLFLDEARQGRGLGPAAIRLVARYLIGERGHHRLTIDPAVANERAIRAYERVGFRPVGVMRRYERGRDGTWHDGLLMELVTDDLAQGGGGAP